MIENPFDETLNDAIATVETLNDETGMNTQEAFELAQSRGYTGNAKSFRDRFAKSGYGEAFGLKRVPHKNGKENWRYFDTQTHT
jgi:hypothetical protein